MVNIVGAIIGDHETTQLHPSPGMGEIVCSEVKTHTIREKATLLMVPRHGRSAYLDSIHIVA